MLTRRLVLVVLGVQILLELFLDVAFRLFGYLAFGAFRLAGSDKLTSI